MNEAADGIGGLVQLHFSNERESPSPDAALALSVQKDKPYVRTEVAFLPLKASTLVICKQRALAISRRECRRPYLPGRSCSYFWLAVGAEASAALSFWKEVAAALFVPSLGAPQA
jgi:hypothetical protein